MLEEAAPTYEYRPLGRDEIRILVLDPSNDRDAPLVLDLKHFLHPRLDALNGHSKSHSGQEDTHNPSSRQKRAFVRYEAVSYAWGTDTQTEAIRVGQGDERSYLRVRRNVVTMLHSLRHSSSVRYLWIDAVCINQRGISEKEVQVRHMGETYEYAERVIIWLRPVSEMSTLTSPPWWDSDKDYFEAFIGQAWFRRRWVIQEAVLAANLTVICGAQEMNFLDLLCVLRLTFRDYRSRMSVTEGSLNMADICASLWQLDMIQSLRTQKSKDPDRKWRLPKLLAMLHNAQCIDDRDRLYAFNGMCDDPIETSYRLATKELYYRMAERELEKDPDFLSYSGSFRCSNLPQGEDVLPQDNPLPSWVPDWRLRPIYLPLVANKYFAAISKDSTDSSFRKRNDVVHLRGKAIASIGLKGDAYNSWFPDKRFQWIAQSYELFMISRHVFMGPVLSTSVFTAVLTAGAVCGTFPLASGSQGWSLRPTSDSDLNASLGRGHSSMSEMITFAATGRCCFLTAADNFAGDFGIAPEDCQVGDVIVEFPGANVPIVLRKQRRAQIETVPVASNGSNGEEEEYWSVVGDCYVHALMERIGEPNDFPLRHFQIV